MYCLFFNFEFDNSIIFKLYGLILNYIFFVIFIYLSENVIYLLYLVYWVFYLLI